MEEKTPPPLNFTHDEAIAANQTWGAGCGHHSIAAACLINICWVRNFAGCSKQWMNPTMMESALQDASIDYKLSKGLHTQEIRDGIARIQWEGHWLNAGVPAAVAYRHTHWIASRDGYILDTSRNPALWVPAEAWAMATNLYLKGTDKTGWHITHWYEFRSDAPAQVEAQP